MKYKNFHSPEREILSKRFSQIPSIEIGLVSIIENYIYEKVSDRIDYEKDVFSSEIKREEYDYVKRYNKIHGLHRVVLYGLGHYISEYTYDNGVLDGEFSRINTSVNYTIKGKYDKGILLEEWNYYNKEGEEVLFSYKNHTIKCNMEL